MTSPERDTDAPERSEVHLDDITRCDIDGACKRSGEDDLALPELGANNVQLVDQPRNTGSRMAHDRRGDSGFLDDAVLRQGSSNPANVLAVLLRAQQGVRCDAAFFV